MNPVLAFVVVMLVWTVSDFVAKKTKSLLSSLFVASIIFLIGFLTGIFPEDLLSSSRPRSDDADDPDRRLRDRLLKAKNCEITLLGRSPRTHRSEYMLHPKIGAGMTVREFRESRTTDSRQGLLLS